MTDETFGWRQAAKYISEGLEVERWLNLIEGWYPIEEGNLVFLNKTQIFRIKPKTRTLAGIEFPEPLREEPEQNTLMFLVNPASSTRLNLHVIRWDGSDWQKKWLRSGLLQATREGAEQAAEAMARSLGGEL